jgi:DNA-binding transcriptional regulator YdaS (Cro superfamily)
MLKVKRLAEENRVQQVALASLLGVLPKRVSFWFGGTGELDAYQARKVAEHFAVPLDWLTDDAQDWPPPQPGKVASDALSFEDRHILTLVGVIGFDESIRRLTQVRQPVIEYLDPATKKPVPPTQSGGGQGRKNHQGT